MDARLRAAARNAASDPQRLLTERRRAGEVCPVCLGHGRAVQLDLFNRFISGDRRVTFDQALPPCPECSGRSCK